MIIYKEEMERFRSLQELSKNLISIYNDKIVFSPKERNDFTAIIYFLSKGIVSKICYLYAAGWEINENGLRYADESLLVSGWRSLLKLIESNSFDLLKTINTTNKEGLSKLIEAMKTMQKILSFQSNIWKLLQEPHTRSWSVTNSPKLKFKLKFELVGILSKPKQISKPSITISKTPPDRTVSIPLEYSETDRPELDPRMWKSIFITRDPLYSLIVDFLQHKIEWLELESQTLNSMKSSFYKEYQYILTLQKL